MNLIGVFIINYNCEKYIEKCINSFLDQDINDFCINVIDDNSDDNSINIIKKFKNKINLIHNKKNFGQFKNYENILLNYGKKYSYISINHSDDYYLPNYLSCNLNLVRKYRNSSIFFCMPINNNNFYLRSKSECFEFNYKSLLREISTIRMFFPTPTAFINMNMLNIDDDIFKNLRYGISNDLFLWTQLSKNNLILISKNKNFYYRQHSNQLSLYEKLNKSNYSPFYEIMSKQVKLAAKNIDFIELKLINLNLLYWLQIDKTGFVLNLFLNKRERIKIILISINILIKLLFFLFIKINKSPQIIKYIAFNVYLITCVIFLKRKYWPYNFLKKLFYKS